MTYYESGTRNTHTSWQQCHLTCMLDYFLWDHVKNIDYSSKPHYEEHRARISNVICDIVQLQLQNDFESENQTERQLSC